MTTFNIPNLTRIHPLILLPGIGVASYVIVGFFIGSSPAAKASQHLAAASGRSSALTSGGIPERMPQTLWSAPATPVAPSAPVIATPMSGGGGASPGAGGGSSASQSTSHSREAGNRHMPPPHAFVAPHNFNHTAPHMAPVAPVPQATQRFAAAQPPVYHPAPLPFFGGMMRGFNGGGHLGGGGGHHR